MLATLLKRLLQTAIGGAPEPERAAGPDGSQWRTEALHLHERGRHRETEALCRRVLEREPDDVDALNFLAAALLSLGEGRAGTAYLRRAAELTRSATAWARLGAVLAATGDADGAIAGYERALALEPTLADASLALAGLLKATGRYDAAEACCRGALAAGGKSAAVEQILASVLFEQGRVDEALGAIRSALALDDRDAGAHSALLRMLNYADGQEPLAVAREHRAWGEKHARGLERSAPPHHNPRAPSRKLRIGYVSPYFRKHAVTFFLETVIEHHDRDRFELILYADVVQPDEYSARLQAHGAAWRATAGLSDEALAKLVRGDAVDILVDLSGHTPGNRLLAFARRPAPVQATWNGYPNTTGMQAMDYRITDAHCDPPGETEHLHSEALLRLRPIYMAWRPPADAPEPGPPPSLASGRTTFGSFNSCYKLTPCLVAMWARILARVPESRLLLLTIDGAEARERLQCLFARHGVDAQRLDIRPRVSHADFLATHREVDIALDAFPYHGTTTTCFSLWMGLPVVTLAGRVHASRVGVTLLENLGMPQWIARDADDYVEIAARLAADRPHLARTRAALRGMLGQSPIADGRTCARSLETAYRSMWAQRCGRTLTGV